MQSIRTRLLFPIIITFCLTWLIGGLFAWDYIKHEIEEVYDAEMVQTSKLLLSMLDHEIKENDVIHLTLEADNLHHEYEANIAFQVWQNNILLVKSTYFTSQHINAPVGFSSQQIEGESWRVYRVGKILHDSDIIIAQSLEIRQELISYIASSMVGPFLVIIPLLAIGLWLLIGKALKPLQRIATDVESKNINDLSLLRTDNIPEEVGVLILSINHLLTRLSIAIDSEQRFTSDAAHELRTPLAGLKTQVQVALRAQNSNQRDNALKQINNAVDRSTHLVEQLLALSRVDPDSVSLKTETIDLCQLAMDLVADLSLLAYEKNIDLGIDECVPANISGIEEALLILFRNVIENAIRYVPEGGTINVSVTREGNHVIFSVSDNGPGISDDDKSKIFERFYRSPQHNSIEGCGLGLSIVKRIADIHFAKLDLSRPANSSGLVFDVIFNAID